MPNIDEAIEALLAYEQADMEGVMVLTSRQAIHEVADELRHMRAVAQSSQVRLATIEECAKFVEQHQETIKEASTGSERYLSPRKVNNLMGLAYVNGLRALVAQPPAAPVETDAVEGELDTIVQLIHKHVGIRQRIDVDLTGVEDAAKAILAATSHPRLSAGSGELLLCPHCGGKADFNNDGDRWDQVICGSCGCRGCEYPNSREKAAAAWNRRAPLYSNREDSITADLADWSSLPRDLYVTSVKCTDGIVFDVQCCSVPMAIGPEVRYSQAIASERQRPADMERERDEARQLVIEANNSLYGSQGYFHSLNGGAFDKYHLARGIEDLKARLRTQPQRSAGTVEDEDPDVMIAARAIAEHGFGRNWDDFHSCDASQTDQGDLIEYGRAAVAALRSRTLPQASSAGIADDPTAEDREYASELLADLANGDLPRLEIAARWFRKARIESEPRAVEPTADMVDAALNAWFKSPPSETDQGLERSMKAALVAAGLLHAQPQAAAVQEALQLAVNIIMDGEPGDSRAVSNEAVALAAVSVGDTSAPVMKVIRDALSRPNCGGEK